MTPVNIASRLEALNKYYGSGILASGEIVNVGAWRVVLDRSRTVDFPPLQGGSIEADLAVRDFINAMAVPLAGGEPVDPFGGRADLERRVLRVVSDRVFDDDPCGSCGQCASRTSSDSGSTPKVRRSFARRPGSSPGCRRTDPRGAPWLSAAGYERAAELGLLEPLGGRARPSAARVRLAVVPPGGHVRREPEAAADLQRPAPLRVDRCCAPRRRPTTRRARSTASAERPEPWALEALAYLGAANLAGAVEQARNERAGRAAPARRRARHPPGPEVGRLLELVAEERAAGTISTREEALELVRRSLE